MIDAEKYLTEVITDLKENHFAVGLKIDFEDEWFTDDELTFLAGISESSGLDLCVKIGGCGASNDMKKALKIGTKSISAPMIESVYALEKYVKTITGFFDEQTKNSTELYINMETKSGLKAMDEILSSESAQYIDGVVLGRTDLTESMALNSCDIDSESILKIANDVAVKSKEHGKKFIIGGGVSPMSIAFFKKLGAELDKYETRKIVFSSESLYSGRAEEGIIKALKFEQHWIKNKNILTSNDNARIKVIESRIECLS